MSPAPLGTALHAGSPLHIDVAEDPAGRLVFTGRVDAHGQPANLSLVVGDGDVAAARRTALASVGAAPHRAVFMEQVHGSAVARVGPADAGRGADDHADAVAATDALITTSSDLALVVMVADCVPVLLVDPGAGVGAVHAGRRGVERNIAGAAVSALAGEDPSSVVAVIGPAVGPCCYEVPADVADQTATVWPQAGAQTTWGTPSLDLVAAVEAQLHASGVSRVERHSPCTRCGADRFFSHRASTNDGAAAGRQAGIILRRGATAADAAPAPRSRAASLDSPFSS